MENSYETRIINCALKAYGYYPLRAMQLWLVDTHFKKANSTMLNIGALAKVPAEINLERLAQAINETLDNYDVFHCRLMFHPDTRDICQRFDGEIFPVQIEKISDEEFERRKEFLQEPYEIINQPLYRIYLFETPTSKYMYLDFYHVIIDGTAIGILFWREVEMRYLGKKIKHQPLRYADYILDELRVSPEELAEGNKFWREITGEFDETKHLPPPDIQSEQTLTENHFEAKVENITHKYFLKTGRKETFYFLAATMLAIAKLSGAKSSNMSLIHNGRNTMQERRLMGVMLEEFPINFSFEKDLNVDELLNGLENKFNTCMKYRRSLGTTYAEGLQEICASFIFQKKIYSATIGGQEFENIDLPPNKWAATDNILDIEVNMTEDDEYYIFIDYDAGRYSENALEKFVATFNEIVAKLQAENILVSEILGC